MINLGRYQLFTWSQDKYSARAIEFVGRSFVCDMCSPLTYNNETTKQWFRNPDSFTKKEWERYKNSGFTVFHLHQGGGLRFFANWNSFLANHAQLFIRIDSVEDLNRVKQSGKFGVILGHQNSIHSQSVDDVNLFYGLGQRVSQLTYNSRNLIGNGCTERSDGGLSNFGLAIVERMNEVGMAVDVAHAGERTTLDTFDVSKKPVIISHSDCRALVPGHPRCEHDDAIRKMVQFFWTQGILYRYPYSLG
jgi:membrane dipeptidase